MSDSLLNYYKALSNPVRLEVFLLIVKEAADFAPKAHQTEKTCVTEIAKTLGIPQPTVSNHVKVLEEAGLIKSVHSGTKCYRYPIKQAAQDLLHHTQYIFEQAHKNPY